MAPCWWFSLSPHCSRSSPIRRYGYVDSAPGRTGGPGPFACSMPSPPAAYLRARARGPCDHTYTRQRSPMNVPAAPCARLILREPTTSAWNDSAPTPILRPKATSAECGRATSLHAPRRRQETMLARIADALRAIAGSPRTAPVRSRKQRRPRACRHCGRLMTSRAARGTRMYCSDRCWRKRNSVGVGSVVHGIHKATNAERGAHGCNPVRRDRDLDSIAQEHAADMAARGRLSHEPGGVTCTDRAIWHGYEHEWPPAGRVWIMDNLAGPMATQPQTGTARAFVRIWMNSPDGHRENMLDMRHRRLGVGVAISRRGGIYAVQAFS